MQIELAFQVIAMHLGSLRADVEGRGDFLSRRSLADEADHLALALGQTVVVGWTLGSGLSRSKHGLCDRRADKSQPRMDRTNRRIKFGDCVSLDEIASRAGVKCLQYVFLIAVLTEY